MSAHVVIHGPYQCSTWPNGYRGGRCKAPASHWLISPDGARNPGGWVCEAHGRAVVDEYAAKLNEPWQLAPLVREAR